MRKSRYNEAQIVGILKEHQAGLGTAELCPVPPHRRRRLSSPLLAPASQCHVALQLPPHGPGQIVGETPPVCSIRLPTPGRIF